MSCFWHSLCDVLERFRTVIVSAWTWCARMMIKVVIMYSGSEYLSESNLLICFMMGFAAFRPSAGMYYITILLSSTVCLSVPSSPSPFLLP